MFLYLSYAPIQPSLPFIFRYVAFGNILMSLHVIMKYNIEITTHPKRSLATILQMYEETGGYYE